MTLEQISQFIAQCKAQRSLSEHSLRAYRQDLMAFWQYRKTIVTNEDVSSDNIVAYLGELRDVQCVAASTTRRRIVTLRAFYKWRTETVEGLASPFDRLKLELKIPRRLPRPVDRPTLSHLFRDARRISPVSADPNEIRSTGRLGSKEITALVVRLLISTGLRIGEATRLRIFDISSGGASIRVHGKGNRERTVYVSNEALLQDLQSYIEVRRQETTPDDFLFRNSRGDRLTEPAFRKRLRMLSTELSITPHLTPHRFRHSAATLLIEEGVDIRLVQRLLGHSSIATTEIYTRVSDTSLISAIKAADTLAKVDF